MSAILAERRISEQDHLQFAELSGDLNPLHVDREAAKSMPPKQRLAYGMDMLLWALESLEALGCLLKDAARIRVRFAKWVFLEDEVELRHSAHSNENAYELLVDGAVVAAFDVLAGERRVATPVDCTQISAARRVQPNVLLLAELEGHKGYVPVASQAHAAQMFPALARRFGAQWVGECATCSYIIGMEAPGLYSMSMRYDLQVCAEPRVAACMHFEVTSADERFRKVRIAVAGAAIAASLEAMVRVPEEA